MKQRPTIESERLILRPFTLADAPEVQRLAGDWDIASTTLEIPHPYEDGMAEQWIGTHQDSYDNDQAINFAITLRWDNTFMGAITLKLDADNDAGELGYWIGKPYWNLGYMTEAAEAVVAYAFQVLELNRIWAAHFKRNPASGRVLQKIGMTGEGCLKQSIKKWGAYEDMEYYGLLWTDYEALKAG